jgi:TatD DNase family protein
MLIDIGVNLMNSAFDRDRERVVREAEAEGVSPLIITGSSEESSRRASEYAAAFPGKLYATAGVHPHEAGRCGNRTLAALAELARRKEIVAIGECGLDYNRDFSPRPVQKEWFAGQLDLAIELALPLFLHERDAFDDLYALLRERRAALPNFVVHCFTGGESELDAYLELGAYIGITGWICDERRGAGLQTLVKNIPPDRLMLETDAPYLIPRSLPRNTGGVSGAAGSPALPAGKRGRNEPKFLPHIAETIAACLDKDPEQLAGETLSNTRRFFGL